MAAAHIIIFTICCFSVSIYSIPYCPIPMDQRFPESMHVYGETMCPNGCCNWTVNGCCSGSNGIPEDQLNAVESIDWIYFGGDYESDWKAGERYRHVHDREKRQLVEATEEEKLEDEDNEDDEHREENRYVAGSRILGIIVVFVGLLKLAYPDHLRV